MARSLNSRCDFENGFFTCDLPDDAIRLILKVKTQTGNHTLVEDMEKQTENSDLGRNWLQMGNRFPESFQGYRLPGTMTTA